MNLILNVNTSLYSIQGSAEGEQKTHAAIADAMKEIESQAKENEERLKKGLKPLPYGVTIKDEYGKDFVVIKETKSLEEIRTEYRKKQENCTVEERTDNLLTAMNEIGNSDKNEFAFKDELKKTLNTALFVTDVELTPGLEKILDYFGDTEGLFNSINFKEDISKKCIKDLIDLPDKETGKPPKSFKDIVSNILAINDIFKNNPDKDTYLDVARSYINLRYKKYIPEKYRQYFEGYGDLKPFVEELVKGHSKTHTIENQQFNVSEKNFKKIYQSLCLLPQFKNKPLELGQYLGKRVAPENKAAFVSWLKSIGCTNNVESAKIFTKWTNEAEKLSISSAVSKNKNDKSDDKLNLRG